MHPVSFLLPNHSKPSVKPSRCAYHPIIKGGPCHTTPENRGQCWITLLIHLKSTPASCNCRCLHQPAQAYEKYSEVDCMNSPGKSKPWMSLPTQILYKVSKAELSANHARSPLETELAQNLNYLPSPRNGVTSLTKESWYLEPELPLLQRLSCK